MFFIHSWKFIHFLSAWHSLRLINPLSLFISTFYWCFSSFFFSSIPSFDFLFRSFFVLIPHSNRLLSFLPRAIDSFVFLCSKTFFYALFTLIFFFIQVTLIYSLLRPKPQTFFTSDVCLNTQYVLWLSFSNHCFFTIHFFCNNFFYKE